MNREDELLIKRINELAAKCYGSSRFIFTDFLNPSEISLILNNERDINYVEHKFYGGTEQCERQMLRFGSADMLGYEEEFPISCVVAEPMAKKFADELGHRDFLGSLMNLGIDRSTIGDIFIKEKTGYIFCVDRIAEYIAENLEKIKHTNVKCRVEKGNIDAIQPELKPVETVVSSERIDAIIAKVYGMSRSQGIEYFRQKKVFVNGRVMENNSYVLKENDIVSVRGFGKFIFDGLMKETKKGRMRVRMRVYI
ncbi:MAG: hypothetical protein HDT39_03860 [Lachnospiraceae bacterium]|nr:hypothetical protein [Lachnospiraceae bacterium]